MLKSLYFVFIILFFSSCSNNEVSEKLDGKKLLKSKCASCHNLNMPPIISDDEKAPPMMAVSFHVHSFVKPSNESQRTSKAIEFVTDYIHNPSLEKSFCDKDSLKRYGLMPSQKENVTQSEAKAISSYMFNHYTQKNLTKIQDDLKKFNSLSQGKKLALKYKCLGCHRVDKKIVGPAFKDISKKYKLSEDVIIDSIKNGSKEKWKTSNGAIMPSFKKINDKELEILSKWILKL